MRLDSALHTRRIHITLTHLWQNDMHKGKNSIIKLLGTRLHFAETATSRHEANTGASHCRTISDVVFAQIKTKSMSKFMYLFHEGRFLKAQMA